LTNFSNGKQTQESLESGFSGKQTQHFEQKTLSGSCEKFRNIMLFANYIKFGPQTFDCYIYFVLNICFSISSLRI
jgi:hypothetical protein